MHIPAKGKDFLAQRIACFLPVAGWRRHVAACGGVVEERQHATLGREFRSRILDAVYWKRLNPRGDAFEANAAHNQELRLSGDIHE